MLYHLPQEEVKHGLNYCGKIDNIHEEENVLFYMYIYNCECPNQFVEINNRVNPLMVLNQLQLDSNKREVNPILDQSS